MLLAQSAKPQGSGDGVPEAGTSISHPRAFENQWRLGRLDGILLFGIEEKRGLKREAAQSQPYSRSTMRDIEVVDAWFELNKGLFADKGGELEFLTQVDAPRTGLADDTAALRDCLQVVRWYQRQIWVKLCRAAGGTIPAEIGEVEYQRLLWKDGPQQRLLPGLTSTEHEMHVWSVKFRTQRVGIPSIKHAAHYATNQSAYCICIA